MVRPDYHEFVRKRHLIHSAKGSVWEDHKYIKKIDGVYYYPNNYSGGHHIGDKGKSFRETDSENRKQHPSSLVDLESYAKDLMSKGEAYYDPDEVSKMSREDLGELYENLTGHKANKEVLDKIYNEKESKNVKPAHNINTNKKYYEYKSASGKKSSKGGKSSSKSENKSTSEIEEKKDNSEKLFNEFESYAKDLMEKGEAYYSQDEVSKLSKEDLGDLYEDIMGKKLSSQDLDGLYKEKERRK